LAYRTDSKPVKQEVNGTVILPPLVFPASTNLKRKVFNIVKVVESNERFEEIGFIIKFQE
jgi:hypothetical protein